MKFPLTSALLFALTFHAIPADASTKRSQSAKVEFKQQHPCPATGAQKGPCKGYVIDHIKPLACGGADAPSNMQWQTKADAKAKDKWERKGC
jgi:hypothetical protein